MSDENKRPRRAWSRADGARNGAAVWSTSPVERASTILFDTVAELNGSSPGLGEYRYGLQGTATHWALSEALTELEPGAAGTALYSSGLAAITTALMAVLSPGDELLVPDSVYGPTRQFCDTFLKRYGVATRYYDPLVGAGIAELIGDNTRAILLESPGSLTMEVQDVPGDLRGGARTRDRDPARQYLGDAASSSRQSPRESTSPSSPRPNMSAAMPTS